VTDAAAAGPARRPGGAQDIPRPAAWHHGSSAPWSGRLGSVPLSVDAVADAVPPLDHQAVDPLSPGARVSAVLIALHDGPGGAEVLLTRRSRHLRTHKGEISFPGGRLDPGETPWQAAVREAWEEVGLDPLLPTPLGTLTHLSTYVSNSYIVPVVSRLARRPPLAPASPEVERVLWVPLAELARRDTFAEERWGLADTVRSVYFFHLDDETVWGATGRMLTELLARVHGVWDDATRSW
jgi:8-oxo-dGTP pyrophosphatase MutT (NUDIX family)